MLQASTEAACQYLHDSGTFEAVMSLKQPFNTSWCACGPKYLTVTGILLGDASIRTMQDVCNDFRDVYYTKCVGVAGFTIMLWDHLVTLADEVEYIWKRPKRHYFIYLFFLNRYLIPLSFIVNIYAYFAHTWTKKSCSHFVRFEGSMTMIGISVVALMMFFRIRGMYRGRRNILGFVLLILMTFIGINAWLLTHGIAADNLDFQYFGFACTMIFDSSVGPTLASASAWLPLLYDTVVVALTLHRTLRPVWGKDPGRIARSLLEEGLLYYSVIFTITFTLSIMIARAQPSVKNITAQLELLLTVTMMSRITIHLRRFAYIRTGCTVSKPTPAPQAEITWRSVTHPSPLRAMMPCTHQGRIQHVERMGDDSFYSKVTTTHGWSPRAVVNEMRESWRASRADVVSVDRGRMIVDLDEEFYGVPRWGQRSAGGPEWVEMTKQKKLVGDEEEGKGLR